MTVYVDIARRSGLYAIVDPDQTSGRDPRDVTRAILRGGCALLQLRAKALPDDAHLALACDLASLCRTAGVPFIVNDRADLAVLADADGVHLGQDDLSLADARIVVGRRLVGRSTHDLAQVEAESGADMLGFGPVYATATKENPSPVVGLSLLREAVSRTSLPIVAIGGITLARVPEVVAAGARLVAAISAITRADDVEAAARAFDTAVRRGA